MLRGVLGLLDDVLDKTVVLGYDRVGFLARRATWNPADLEVDMRGRLCLVTGANSGLGFATANGLAQRGARVILVCRNPERGAAAVERILREAPTAELELEIADLSVQAEVRNLVERISDRHDSLDVLVNNAGALFNERRTSADGHEMTFALNVLSVFLLTNLLLPYLKSAPAARVINVSSGGMYLADLGLDDPEYEVGAYDGVKAYARSKRAELVLTQLWAEKAGSSGVLFFCMHPGWADTPGVQHSLPVFRTVTQFVLRSAEEGADTILWLAVHRDLDLGDSGKFWFDRRPRAMHRLESTRNTESEKRRYWKLCEELTGSTAPF